MVFLCCLDLISHRRNTFHKPEVWSRGFSHRANRGEVGHKAPVLKGMIERYQIEISHILMGGKVGQNTSRDIIEM